MSDFQYRSLKLICFLCALNFLAFIVVAIAIGGDAVSGKVVGGHYYIANKGKLTEVTAAVFTYSRWHFSSMFFTGPLAMMIGYRLKKEKVRRKRSIASGGQFVTWRYG